MAIKRCVIVDGDVAYVPLTRGYIAVIDASDVPLVDRWNWCARPLGNTVYAYRKERIAGKQCQISMHRAILGSVGFSAKGDHRDGNGLNNRRGNLRECSHAENMRNRGAQQNNSIGLKGVSSIGPRWRAEIKIGRVQKHLGCFDTPEAAHAAYCAAAADLHGDFARTA